MAGGPIGHGIDRPGQAPRFPPTSEARARRLIEDKLGALLQAAGPHEELCLLASGAPGADILAQEVAAQLGIARCLCLPMPTEHVSSLAFQGLDAWRPRFLELAAQLKGKATRQLADHAELPRWLQGRGIDLWSRGNRWALKLAKTWGAERVTVVALWDGADNGADGGTAQMVRLARQEGGFVFDPIDSRQLLG